MRIRAGRLLMKLALALVLAVALSEVLTTGAFAQTNDYPFASSTPDTVDPYDFYTRECTSFVAWRMNRDAGTTDQAHPDRKRVVEGKRVDLGGRAIIIKK